MSRKLKLRKEYTQFAGPDRTKDFLFWQRKKYLLQKEPLLLKLQNQAIQCGWIATHFKVQFIKLMAANNLGSENRSPVSSCLRKLDNCSDDMCSRELAETLTMF